MGLNCQSEYTLPPTFDQHDEHPTCEKTLCRLPPVAYHNLRSPQPGVLCLSRRVELITRVEQCELLRFWCATGGCLQRVLSALRITKVPWFITNWKNIIKKILFLPVTTSSHFIVQEEYPEQLSVTHPEE